MSPPLPEHAWTRPLRGHLVGVCGAGMKALAEALTDRGWTISGCDSDPDPGACSSLRKLGVEVHCVHSPEHLPAGIDVLIHSAAIGEDHSERRRARELHVPQCSYVEAVARLSHQGECVAISGTHGKSTVTAMLGAILETAGRSPSVLCGAESLDRRRSGWSGAGSHVVIEACEYRRHFLNYRPDLACVTNIQPDHFDTYATLADAAAGFREFLAQVPAQGRIVANADCPATRDAAHGRTARVVWFSAEDAAADWHLSGIAAGAAGVQAQLHHRGMAVGMLQLKIPGRHNAVNALAAAACAGELGVSPRQILSGLANFSGIARRFENKGAWRGAIVIDDYAHHPTEVQATLQAARDAYPQRKLVCVFQPHQLSRTRKLLPEFVESLNLASQVYLLPVYAAREDAGPEQLQLAQDIANRVRVPAGVIPSLDRVWETLQTDAGADAVILTLGAGTLTRIHHEPR